MYMFYLDIYVEFAFSNNLWEASADVPDDGAADLVDVDRGDGDLEAGPKAQKEAASV